MFAVGQREAGRCLDKVRVIYLWIEESETPRSGTRKALPTIRIRRFRKDALGAFLAIHPARRTIEWIVLLRHLDARVVLLGDSLIASLS